MAGRITFTILRIFVGLIFVSHAIERAWVQKTVGGFGEFLSAKGFPMGVYLAWFITVFELGGGMALAFNKATLFLAIGFILHQVMGIILVHAQNGWFVVGSGSGGMEYSALIVICLAVIGANAYEKK